MARHRLQRLSSPSPTLSLLLHLVGVASFAYSFHFLTAWDTPISRAFGWHFQFLTVIGLSGSLLAFVLGTLADVTSSAALFAAKNAVSIVVTPLEALISVLYWAIFSYDASLLMPPDVKLSVPVDLNFHLVPAVLLTLDLLFFSPPNVVSTNGMAAIGAAMATLYWHWVELCHEKNGWYPYPFFDMLATKQRAFLFAFSVFLVVDFSIALKWLYTRLNGSAETKQQASEKVQ